MNPDDYSKVSYMDGEGAKKIKRIPRALDNMKESGQVGPTVCSKAENQHNMNVRILRWRRSCGTTLEVANQSEDTPQLRESILTPHGASTLKQHFREDHSRDVAPIKKGNTYATVHRNRKRWCPPGNYWMKKSVKSLRRYETRIRLIQRRMRNLFPSTRAGYQPVNNKLPDAFHGRLVGDSPSKTRQGSSKSSLYAQRRMAVDLEEASTSKMSYQHPLIKNLSEKADFVTLKSFLEQNFGNYKFSCDVRYLVETLSHKLTNGMHYSDVSVGYMGETDVCNSDYDSVITAEPYSVVTLCSVGTHTQEKIDYGAFITKEVNEDGSVIDCGIEVVGEEEVVDYDEDEDSTESEVSSWVGISQQLRCDKCKFAYEKGELLGLTACLHKFCRHCLTHSVRSQLSQTIMTCPAVSSCGQKSCSAYLGLTVIEEVVPANLFMKWMEFVSYQISKDLRVYDPRRGERRMFSRRGINVVIPHVDSESSFPSPRLLKRTAKRTCSVKAAFRMPPVGKMYDNSYFV